ncbi:hypothetical protein YTPLAS18_04460 [Nitrospira sp.]|nr:hypothetical protein YTPLAS18_04460 [Nitrospira sp.]
MTDQHATLQAIVRQASELESISKWVSQELNTVAGSERLGKWKAATIEVLRRHAGNRIAGQFAKVKPGMSFTNDLVEEFQEEVETYRAALTAAAKAVQAQGLSGSTA